MHSSNLQLVHASTQALRPASTILMGKNTMMKRSIRIYIEESGDDKWACLIDCLVGNVGVLFSTTDLNGVKAEVDKFRVGAGARQGVIAPNDVSIPSGPTGMDPSQTSFFQVSCTHSSLSRDVLACKQLFL